MAPVPDGDEECPHGKESDIGDIETPQFNIAVDSDTTSDEEDETGPIDQGYQLLPQDPDAAGDSLESEGVQSEAASLENTVSVDNVVRTTLDHDVNQCSGFSQNLPDVPNSEAEERREVWNRQKSNTHNIVMDTEHVQKIKAVMANIKLPTPDWAKKIPEDMWKEQLFSRLQQQDTEEQNSKNYTSSDSKTTKTASTLKGNTDQQPSTSKGDDVEQINIKHELKKDKEET